MPRIVRHLLATNYFSEILLALGFAMAIGAMLVQSGPSEFPAPYQDFPVELIARDLNVPPERVREAFRKLRPGPYGELSTASQREADSRALADAIGVSPECLLAVMDTYRPRI